MKDPVNIWNADDEINDDELMKYINKKSSDNEQHNIQSKMNDSSFISDAVDGLEQFSSSQKINNYVENLNTGLHKKLKDKSSKRKRGIKSLSLEIVSIVIIIVLCILGYVVIEMMKK